MNAIEYIGKEVKVIIDRPIGSSHPDYPDHIYLVNYGYVPNTVSGDGEELDCYILGVAIVIYWWASREERIEREIQINQKVFSTPKLDTTMEEIVNKIRNQMSFLKRKLTEEEKNEIIENCIKQSFNKNK